MAAVPVEDAGVGSAVNDVSRELGSALGVAVIGSFISSIYKDNVDDRLAGQVDPSVVETAKEGVGVLAATAQSLSADVAQTAFAGASEAVGPVGDTPAGVAQPVEGSLLGDSFGDSGHARISTCRRDGVDSGFVAVAL